MEVRKAVQSFGFIGIIGGLAYIPARFFIQPEFQGAAQGIIGWSLDTVALLGSLFLFTGMMLVQLEKLGKFGFFSYIFLMLMSALMAGHQYGLILLAPVIVKLDPSMMSGGGQPPLHFLIATIGNVGLKMIAMLMFAGVCYKLRMLPRWAIAVMIVGALADFAPLGDYIGRIVVGISFIALGSALWREGQAATSKVRTYSM